MNWQQTLSTLRAALAVSGPLGGLLIKFGVPVEQLSTGIDAIIALAAVSTPLAAWVWSLFTHTKANAVATVAAMPEVKSISLEPAAPGTRELDAATPANVKVGS